LDAILKQKKISEPATQQLLLDTYNVKTLMLHLPTLSPETSINKTAPGTGMYAKFVNSKITYIEMILKLVGTPEDMLLDRFKIMWPDGQPKDLQLIMSLKGTKRADQQAILEIFGLSKPAPTSDSTTPTNPAGSKITNIFSGNTGTGTTTLNQTFAATTAATSAASAAAFSSMKSLTQDLSSTARSAFGNLKLSSSTNK
jgi:ribosomal protein S11